MLDRGVGPSPLWPCDQGKLVRMEQRISLITLGVTDLVRARSFYEGLGWACASGPDEDVAFFQTGGMVFALWDQARLAEDSGVLNSPGWGGVTLAHNVGSPDEVDTVLEEAQAAGGTITRRAGPTFFGGYSGVFTDPDGHPWEVAHNPGWHLHPDGTVTLA
jgi:predicted lactoylglutathione lyase